MDFLKLKRFRKPHHVLNEEKDSDQVKTESVQMVPKSDAAADSAVQCEDDDDDDEFIASEVKRRLKELRRNSCMVLIPEDSCPDYDSCSSDLRESESEENKINCGFGDLYDKYCEHMAAFDKVIAHALPEAASWNRASSPKSSSKKITSALRSLSLKRRGELNGESEFLQSPPQQQQDPNHDLEAAYVAHLCLSWEALHSQYMQLRQIIASDFDDISCYGYAAQQFQQFQVLLQRYIENEPFEQGSRVEIYARTRSSMPKLLHVPYFRGIEVKEDKEEEENQMGNYLVSSVLSSDLCRVIETSILTFYQFMKMDKKKNAGVLNLFGTNEVASTLQLVQASLNKKEMRLKELRRKKKGWKEKTWPASMEEVELLFGLIDAKVISRVLRIVRISREQLLWCEEKMSKLDATDKFRRDNMPTMFPS